MRRIQSDDAQKTNVDPMMEVRIRTDMSNPATCVITFRLKM